MRLIKFGFLFFLPLFFSLGALRAQDNQATYEKAKDYFDQGEYTFAMEYFRQLTVGKPSHPYKDYAAFYYGLSAYKSGDLNTAKSMWLQMTMKNKGWNNMPDVYYWLAEVYFAESDLDNGCLYAVQSGLTVSDELMQAQLYKVDSVAELEKLHYEFPDNRIIGLILAKKIVSLPLSARNVVLLENVIDTFEFDREALGLVDVNESELKDTYKVAVLLPFMFDGLNDPRRTVRNRFIMDLYQGIEEAVKDLNKKEQKIELLAYDTRRDSSTTAQLLALPEMRGMDMIIGPLFPVPSKLVADFSFQYRINMINPLSTTSDVVGNNPFSFLFKSTVETQALAAAQLAIDSISNRSAMIFYEDNQKDSLSAYTYAQRIMEEGFEVVLLEAVTDTTVRSSYDLLTEKFEVEYTKQEADSIRREDDTRIIKEKRSIKEKDVQVYYEEFFRIAPDSIGHLYVASSKTLFASNYISAVEIRADSTKIIGRGEWRDSETLTFEEMERLGVYFVDPMYLDDDKYSYKAFRDRYTKKYRKLPAENALVAYDMMMSVGYLMVKYGNHFQTGTLDEGMVKGKIYNGLEYAGYNSNQRVPITRFDGAQLRIINSGDGKREE
ncbi:hypothetical protein BFP72_05035 [Reichenbachiella sp. 5M10]|uniref:ABC transporter substrate-binding protein n=1 Tax=Reichenbachiella sp. 5M10 TaxID=1889772 RepID=UPI000C152EE5|nr:ABC transporter substrate-binding protein [Reichenbachiella sp. 5M10]PIB34813.1 hypothetical protein BFP72_05035 [Reichenbachiella sp. 5M10]